MIITGTWWDRADDWSTYPDPLEGHEAHTPPHIVSRDSRFVQGER
jgi:hypothetical protein